MRLAALLSALALPALAAATPPQPGVFTPGESLGGLRLGATPAQVRAAWGTRFGRCRSCAHDTWYFNYRPFAPQGAGVEFRRGRVAAIFTLWSPRGWRTAQGVAIGDDAGRIGDVYGPLAREECGAYVGHVLERGRTSSVFYETGGRVWGFALLTRPSPVCR
jgi:hypothetical protein